MMVVVVVVIEVDMAVVVEMVAILNLIKGNVVVLVYFASLDKYIHIL
jgi:hypothetical protein